LFSTIKSGNIEAAGLAMHNEILQDMRPVTGGEKNAESHHIANA